MQSLVLTVLALIMAFVAGAMFGRALFDGIADKIGDIKRKKKDSRRTKEGPWKDS